MRRWSGEGQTEPLAALAAVAVVATALALYAGAFERSVPAERDRNVAADAADRVERALTDGGVVRARRNGLKHLDAPDGYEMNVTLTASGVDVAHGPPAPDTADVARRRVSVVTRPGDVDPGRLEVRVWR